MEKTQIAIFALLSVLAILLSLYFGGGFTRKPVNLGEVEVNEYMGQNLTPISSIPTIGIKGTQKIDVESYRLKVTGLVAKPLELTYDGVLKSYTPYSKVVKIICVEGWDATILWEGVLISDLIDSARASESANTVIFKCADGYTTSLPLEYVRNAKILLAYKMNNIEIPEDYGFPFKVVAEAKWGYKWASWVTEIEVSDNADYEGYWEERGFPNEADIEHP